MNDNEFTDEQIEQIKNENLELVENMIKIGGELKEFLTKFDETQKKIYDPEAYDVISRQIKMALESFAMKVLVALPATAQAVYFSALIRHLATVMSKGAKVMTASEVEANAEKLQRQVGDAELMRRMQQAAKKDPKIGGMLN